MHTKNITINSAILFIIATTLQTTLHEAGHFFTATFLHSNEAVLYHNYVRHDSANLSNASSVWIAAAGPLVSFLIGIVCHITCALYQKRNLWFLFMLYLCIFSYICFFGYLMIAPMAVEGDTGYIFHELGFPLWVTIIIAIAGVAVMIYMLKRISSYFAEMGTKEIMEDVPARTKFVDALIKYPLYIGVIITTLLNLPVYFFLSLIYPLCSPFALMWSYGYVVEGKYPTVHTNKDFDQLNRFQPVLIIPLLLIVIINRLLVYGFSI